MRHFCDQNLMEMKIREQLRKAQLLAQVPGQGGRILKALERSGKIQAFALVNQ